MVSSLCLALLAASDPTTDEEPRPMLSEILKEPELATVARRAEEFRLQIVLGQVEGAPDGALRLRQETFRADEEYFYPASSIKLFAALAAVERVRRLREAEGIEVDLDTPLTLTPRFSRDGRAESPTPETFTVRRAVREIFLVSDNLAYNQLYEFVGPDGLAAAARRAGLERVRIVHRLSEFHSPSEHLQLPRIEVASTGTVFPARTSETLPMTPEPPRLEVGKGYYRGGELVEGPMHFGEKNRLPLTELQRALCMVVRPDVDCGGSGFELTEDERALFLEAMSQFPRQSEDPVYDAQEYPDDYVKPMLEGIERVLPGSRVAIYNKTGQAYGFSIENAWVVDRETDRGFFLTATLYTNQDGVLNDDVYEYEQVATPFLQALGQAVAERIWLGARAR